MFFSRKKDNLIGLDIGSRTIKVGEVNINKRVRTLKKSGMQNMYTLNKFGMRNIPPEIIHEGVIKDSDTLAEAIRELFREMNIKETNVAISVSGYSVIVKRISLQKMTADELSNRINYEAEQYIPFDINDVNLDFQILGESEENSDHMSVILVAAKKDMINDYIHLLENIELFPAVIDVDCFALQNIHELVYGGEDTVALIDVGANKTNVNIVKNNNSLFMRDISLGGEQFTQDIIARVECTFEEAEEIKQVGESEFLPQEEYMEIKASTIMYWCSELKRAIDFYYSSSPEHPIKKILLSGGSAFVGGLKSALAEETSVDVDLFDPFQFFEIDESQLDADFLKRIAPQASICMGLSIRRVGDK